MALPATLVFEVRPTNGTADGGGSFDPSVAAAGTDFSQQNAVQVAYADLVVGAVNTDVSSAAAPFTAADVGNTLVITTTGGGGAWTVGHYNIRSHAAGVVRLDRSPAAVASTAGVGNLGGARSGYSNGVTPIQGIFIAGNTVHVKNEAWNEAVALTVLGAAGAPITHIGYGAARGDNPTGATRPTNNRAAAAGDAFTITANNILKYIIATAAGDAGFSITSQPVRLEFCRATANTGEGLEGGGNLAFLIGFESDLNGVGGTSTTIGAIFGGYIHDNTGQGVVAGANGFNMEFTIIDSNSSHGVSGLTSQSQVLFNTIYGSTGANTDGASWGTPNAGALFIGNILATNNRYGVNATDGDSMYSNFNDFSGNGTAARNNVPTGAGDSTLDPQFTNAAAGNFTIGSNLKALGFPGVFPGALTTGYLDMGAAQRQEAGAGGSFGARTVNIGGSLTLGAG